MKKSWVDFYTSKQSPKKWFEQNTVPWTAQKNRTTKNWVEEDLNKFPKKDHKVFVKQVCFPYGESPRTPSLEGTSPTKH